jgi:hypothetical protein
MSSPPILVWTSWSPTNSSSKGVLSSGVVLGPCPSFQIRNAGQDAGGFNAVMAGREVVLNEMDLGLDDGEFVAEVLESVVSASVLVDFGGCVPVVKVSNGVTESVVCRSGAVEESVEPNGDWCCAAIKAQLIRLMQPTWRCLRV